MSTFFGHGSRAMLESVAGAIDSIPDDVDVYMIHLTLNGRHGEFDLVVQGSDADGEGVLYEGIAHRSGGVSPFGRVWPD